MDGRKFWKRLPFEGGIGLLHKEMRLAARRRQRAGLCL
jgi:hypothetical protein